MIIKASFGCYLLGQYNVALLFLEQRANVTKAVIRRIVCQDNYFCSVCIITPYILGCAILCDLNVDVDIELHSFSTSVLLEGYQCEV